MSTDPNDIAHLRVMVSNILIDMGLYANLRGYHYLREAIVKGIEEPRLLNNFTQRMYPAVAEEFDTNATRVERGMRSAIERLWERGRLDQMGNYFGTGFYINGKKPTNSEFIATMVVKISNHISIYGV